MSASTLDPAINPGVSLGLAIGTLAKAGRDKLTFLADDEMPRTECLKDVIARMLPYWESDIIPDLADGRTVLVAGGGPARQREEENTSPSTTHMKDTAT